MKEGFAIHIYTLNKAMSDTCMANADGDMLIVPQQGPPIAVAPGVRACLACACAVLVCWHVVASTRSSMQRPLSPHTLYDSDVID
jgi:hypothetical protein